MKFNLTSIKRLVLLIGVMFFIIPQSLMAQKQKPQNLRTYDNEPYHFGFIIAYNNMSYAFKYIDNYQITPHSASEYPNTADTYFNADAVYYATKIESNQIPGFTVGVVGNLRLGKYFDLRLIPSLSFGTRTITYDFFRTVDNNGMANKQDMYFSKKKSIFSTFVEFPLQVKYRSKRLNNVAAYLIAGTNFKIDLASQKKSQIEVNDPITGEQHSVIDNIRVKRGDIAAEIGAGFDFYTSYFKFGVEVKMSYGLLNILDSQNLIYDSSIKSLQNRTFQVSLTFE